MASFGTRFDYPLDTPTKVFPAEFVGGLMLGRYCRALVFYPNGDVARANVAWRAGTAVLDREVPAGATVTIYRETEPEHTIVLARPGAPISAAALNGIGRHIRSRLHELREIATKKPPLGTMPGVLFTSSSGVALVQVGLGWVLGALQLPDPNWISADTVELTSTAESSGLARHRFPSSARRHVFIRIDRVSPWISTNTGFELGCVLGSEIDYWQRRVGPGGDPWQFPSTVVDTMCDSVRYTNVFAWAKRAFFNYRDAAYHFGGGSMGNFGPGGANTSDTANQSMLYMLQYAPENSTDGTLVRTMWSVSGAPSTVFTSINTAMPNAQDSADLAFYSRIRTTSSQGHIRQVLMKTSEVLAQWPELAADVSYNIAQYSTSEVE